MDVGKQQRERGSHIDFYSVQWQDQKCAQTVVKDVSSEHQEKLLLYCEGTENQNKLPRDVVVSLLEIPSNLRHSMILWLNSVLLLAEMNSFH